MKKSTAHSRAEPKAKAKSEELVGKQHRTFSTRRLLADGDFQKRRRRRRIAQFLYVLVHVPLSLSLSLSVRLL